ncbi:MAG: CRTAC1 family protein [Chloroflexota bacterium]
MVKIAFHATSKNIILLLAILIGTGCAVQQAPTASSNLGDVVQRQAQSSPFVDVSAAAGITATHRAFFKMDAKTGYLGIGQAWGDYDNDGWVDLCVTGNLDPNVLYHNNQDGTFSISTLSPQVSLPESTSGGVTWADYNNDGWLDLYVINAEANVIFHNDRGIGFQDVTARAGVGDTGKGQSAAWGDYDNDGLLDLYVVNWSCMPECKPVDFALHQDRLYHNNGDGTFTDVSDSLPYPKTLGSGFAGSFLDYDNDGDLDIYVVNDEYKNSIGNVLWRNDGPATNNDQCGAWCWSDGSDDSGAGIVISGMGLAIADYDNDGDLDTYFTNMVRPMALLQNQGDGTFINVEEAAGVGVHENSVVGWGPLFFDINNDGWQDLFLAASTTEPRKFEPGGMQDMHYPRINYLFYNLGDGTFINGTPAQWFTNQQVSMGAAYADYDNDGWVDFVVGNWNEGYTLFRNSGRQGKVGTPSNHHWFAANLVGADGMNRNAIGARIYLTTTDGQTQMQEVQSGSSLGAGNALTLYFGLGTAEIEEVEIVWPDGVSHIYPTMASDRIWWIYR